MLAVWITLCLLNLKKTLLCSSLVTNTYYNSKLLVTYFTRQRREHFELLLFGEVAFRYLAQHTGSSKESKPEHQHISGSLESLNCGVPRKVIKLDPRGPYGSVSSAALRRYDNYKANARLQSAKA